MAIKRFALGPVRSDRDKEIALVEMAYELNRVIELAESGDLITSIEWSAILNTPTTIAGYGITDAYTKTETDTLLAGKANTVHTHAWGDITGEPTTLAGYGITDAYTKTEVDTLLNALSFASIDGTLAYAQLPTGGGTWANGGNLVFTGGDFVISALAKYRLDGSTSGNTYLWESTGDNIAFVAGGVTALQVGAGFVGVGQGPNASVGLYVRSNVLTSADQYGVWSGPTVSSAATNTGVAYYAELRTAATSFTLGSGYGIQVADAVKGAGSTITTFYGIRVMPLTAGASNWAILTGANNWAIGATGKIFLDGGSDTYIYEAAANQMAFYAGGVNTMTMIATGLAVAATLKVWLDGGNDTYVYESGANLLDLVANSKLTLRGDGATGLADGETSVLVNRRAAGAESLQRLKWKDFTALAGGDKVLLLAA